MANMSCKYKAIEFQFFNDFSVNYFLKEKDLKTMDKELYYTNKPHIKIKYIFRCESFL